MKISERFNLERTQYELDFVDIDPSIDTRLFLDPYYLGHRTDPFSVDATRTIRSFFQRFIELMRQGRVEDARRLFDHLHEPNETCLGLSVGRPRGNGIGDRNANTIFESIRQSRALQTGLLENLEDFRIFVPNIDKDKVSDMTTNIIREHLIQYTQSQCQLWGIPLQPGVPSGEYWNRHQNRWEQTYAEMLVVDGRKILLVPKSIVSYAKRYSHQQFHQHYVLNFLQNEHLRMDSVLVQRRRLRSGEERVWVTKESVKEHEAPLDKDYLTDFTIRHHQVFNEFRLRQAQRLNAIENSELDPRADLENIIDTLVGQITSIPAGNNDATRYHRTVASILELIFYPRLTCLHLEREINAGRKRVDITFDNSSTEGIFWRLAEHYQTPCPYIFIECKNYGREVGNPEVDQLVGRFHVNRGKFGLLVCRSLVDRETLINRCRDAFHAQQGIILPLIDDDLLQMLQTLRQNPEDPAEEVRLSEILREVTLG
jgi:hypothetical protein